MDLEQQHMQVRKSFFPIENWKMVTLLSNSILGFQIVPPFVLFLSILSLNWIISTAGEVQHLRILLAYITRKQAVLKKDYKG